MKKTVAVQHFIGGGLNLPTGYLCMSLQNVNFIQNPPEKVRHQRAIFRTNTPKGVVCRSCHPVGVPVGIADVAARRSATYLNLELIDGLHFWLRQCRNML